MRMLEPVAARWHRADWPLAGQIGALTTTREGGVSEGPYQGLNLALHVGDSPERVSENRRRLLAATGCERIQWLAQVHGTRVVKAGLPAPAGAPAGAPEAVPAGTPAGVPEADAVWTDEPGLGIAVLTADCLPVVIGARGGGLVAVAHAGWRGLVDGVLEATVRALPCAPSDCIAWLGPAIGPGAYEVGADVAERVRVLDGVAEAALLPGRVSGKYRLNLFLAARLLLRRAGVTEVHGKDLCTHSDTGLYSYRRDGATGRMATVAWLRERGGRRQRG